MLCNSNRLVLEVKQGEEYFNNSTFENDIQLQQALDTVVK